MILFINTATDDKEISLIKNKKIIKKIIFQKRFGEAENLLLMIDKLLKEGKTKIKDLKRIIAVKGPGNFTSLRIGILIANTLAYTLKIPVYGIKLDELDGLLSLKFKSRKIEFVLPFYGKDPSITLK